MESATQFLLTIGGILLLGLFTSYIGRRTWLPRVTLLLLFGVVIGQSGLNIIPQVFNERFDVVANMALVMVGFLLGGKMAWRDLRRTAGPLLWISLSAAIGTTLIVSAILIAFGVEPGMAILLGCIASATDAAAVFDVVAETRQSGKKPDGAFGNLLLSIVALDDAWALIIFSVGVALVSSLAGGLDTSALSTAGWEIGGAVVLGCAIGFPAAFLTGRAVKGQPLLTEALGLVFLCGGLAMVMEVSFLMAAMVMGMVVTNVARHHENAFHEIENIESTVMVIFFVLAGASLDISALNQVALLVAFYVGSRSIGKIAGGWLGAWLGRTDLATRRWVGVALLPQAGVAIGMALVASGHYPAYGQGLLSILVSTTIIFEIVGPVFTRLSLERVEAQD
jgi:Kef-type K+ transport system membrane component KefB